MSDQTASQALRPYVPVNLVTFRFQGGLATRGELNFYEAGRYRYASARLLYMLEHFRNTGEVLERLRTRVNADFRVSAASEGSFLDTIQLYLATIASDAQQIGFLSQIPFQKLLSWALDKALPPSSTNKRMLDILQKQIELGQSMQETARERERTGQAREQTAQIQAQQATEQLRAIADLIQGRGNPDQTDLDAAGQVASAMDGKPSPAAPTADPDLDPAYVAAELRAEINRVETFGDVENRLDEIPEHQVQRMTERIRKTLPDLGFPLRRSATNLSVEVQQERMPIAALNHGRIEQITKVDRDDNAVVIAGDITRLDKDSGFGRFRPNGSGKALPFSVPREIWNHRRERFIDAFGASEVQIEALPFRDGIGNIVKLLLLNVS